MLQKGSNSQKDVEQGLAEGEKCKPSDKEKCTAEEKCTPEEELSEYSHITIPLPGVGIDGKTANEASGKRDVPIHCAICLSDYEESEKVSWSSNCNCSHVFHEEVSVRKV